MLLFAKLSPKEPRSKDFPLNSRICADATAVNSTGTKTLLVSGLSTYFIKGKLVFIKGLRSLPKNPPNCTMLDNWVFENFILTDEPFAKASQIFETYVLVNNNLCGKLVSSLASPITFYETFIVT